jgi:hypothetical protein
MAGGERLKTRPQRAGGRSVMARADLALPRLARTDLEVADVLTRFDIPRVHIGLLSADWSTCQDITFHQFSPL